MRIILIVYWSLFFCLTANAQQAVFELKGLYIGMSSSDAKSKFSNANCDTKDATRFCSVMDIPFGPIKSANLFYILLDDKIMSIKIILKEAEFGGVVDALRAKFGASTVETTDIMQNRMGAKFDSLLISWINGDIRLKATQRFSSVDQSSVELVSDSATKEWFRRKKEKSAAAADGL